MTDGAQHQTPLPAARTDAVPPGSRPARPARPEEPEEPLVALLDPAGVIAEVNRAWQDFCRANGGDPAAAGPGVSYLAVCASAAGDPAADEVARAIRAAVRGALPAPVSVLLPCHSPAQARWYHVRVAARPGGATVTATPALAEGSALPAEAARELIDLVPDGILVSDHEGVITYVNQRLEALSGYDRSELLGRPVEVLVPAGATTRHAGLHQSGSGTALWPMRAGSAVELCHRDGTGVPVEITLAQVRVDGSLITGAAVRDVRERLAHEERLRTSEELFRTAFEKSPVGMAVVRLAQDGRQRIVERANQALADVLGEPVDQLTGTDLAAFGLPADEPATAAGAAGLTAGQPQELARLKRYRRRDGTVIWAEVRATVVPFADLPGPTLLIHVCDVTEREHLALRRAQRAAMSAVVARVATSVLAGVPPDEVDDQISAGVRSVFGAQEVSLAGLGPDGGITITRAPGSGPLSDDESRLLAELGQQAGLAVELGQARRDQQRLAVLEDRHRIAQDLHDTVIQDLIAVGMQLASRRSRISDQALRDQDDDLIGQLEKAVSTLRAAVHHLQAFSGGEGLADTVRLLAAESVAVLGHVPDVAIRGPVDALAPDAVRGDALAVVREALSNVARHAGASRTAITVAAGQDRLTVTVRDDGSGIAVEAPAGNGLGNIQHRARARGGRATISPLPHGGTEVVWSVPLPAAAPGRTLTGM